jgi:outer membrane immunogenic protein
VNYMFNGRGPFAPVSKTGTVTSPLKMPGVRSPYDWTGFYFGVDGGFARQRSSGTLTAASGAVLTPYGYSGTGPFAGPFVGGNYQFNRFVLGVEGDWQWSNLTGNDQVLAALGSIGALPSGPFTVSTTTKDYDSIRGRLGFAIDRFLLFGTGGWATGNPSTAFALTGSAAFVTVGGKSNGWTVGGGLEYAITDTILGRIEYRYTDLQTSGFVNVPANIADGGSRTPISDFRIGFAYKFGGGL